MASASEDPQLHQVESTTNVLIVPDSERDICPYKPGVILKLTKSGEDIIAVIKRVFSGSINHQFSGSCTMLIQIKETQEASFLGRHMVLKIFDWRYITTARYEIGMDDCDPERLRELFMLSDDERFRLQTWLQSPVPQEHRNHALIRRVYELLEAPLPPKPKNRHVFEALLYKPEDEVQEYVAEGLFPALSNALSPNWSPNPAYVEIFLSALATFDAKVEDHVSQMVSKKIPDRMPKAYGIFNITLVNVGSWPLESEQFSHTFSIQALLMDEVPGRPTRTTDDYTTSQTAEALVHELLMFQLQLARCNLQMWDRNPDNILIKHDLGNGAKIMIVDYSALKMINSDVSDFDTSRIWLDEANYFRGDNEAKLVFNLLGGLTGLQDPENPTYHFDPFRAQHVDEYKARPQSPLEVRTRELVTHCFNPFEAQHTTTNEDQYAWCTIMLQIIYSYDEGMSTDDAASLLSTVYLARQIMMEEFTKTSEESWWLRAVKEIIHATTGDPSHAQSLMSKLMEISGPGYDRTLPLLFAQTSSQGPREMNIEPLFPRQLKVAAAR